MNDIFEVWMGMLLLFWGGIFMIALTIAPFIIAYNWLMS